MAEDNGVVYSVKELLAIQNEALGRIETKVDAANMRTVEAVAKIDLRVSLLEKREDLEPRLRLLEDVRIESQGARKWWDSFWARLIGAGAVVGGLWWLPQYIHHG